MNLSNMKQTKAEREKKAEPVPFDGDEYPYGLRIRLDSASLKKLRFALPKVGTKVTIHARGAVTSVSSNESERDQHSSVEIQIQRLAISKGAESMEEAVSDGIEEADTKD